MLRASRLVHRVSWQYMDEKTGAQLDEHEIRRYLEFCGERSYVTPDEMVSERWLAEITPSNCFWPNPCSRGCCSVGRSSAVF